MTIPPSAMVQVADVKPGAASATVTVVADAWNTGALTSPSAAVYTTWDGPAGPVTISTVAALAAGASMSVMPMAPSATPSLTPKASSVRLWQPRPHNVARSALVAVPSGGPGGRQELRPGAVVCDVRGLLLIAVMWFAVGASPARAASVAVRDGILSFTAAPGETNKVVLELRAGDPDHGSGRRPAGRRAGMLGHGRRIGDVREQRSAAIDTGDRDDEVEISVPGVVAHVEAGPGDDVVTNGTGGGTASGAAGNDRLFGDSGADLLVGGPGDDTLQGAPGDDRLAGGSGRDELDGEDGDDRLTGGDGRDLVTGGDGADRLGGGSGADVLDGGVGTDEFDAGAGDDEVIAVDQGADTVACGDGTDAGRSDPADALAADCEDFQVEGGGVNTLQTMLPFPVVRIVGSVSGSRTTIRRLSVKVPANVRVYARCHGRGCPSRRWSGWPAARGRCG